MAIEDGQTILNGKYHIIRLLGEGGMARVWLAEELTFGKRLVALKEPRGDLPEEVREEVTERYRREVMVCAELEKERVPHIVRALTAEPLENQVLLALEYMPGGDLVNLLREHPQGLPPTQAITIAQMVLEALQAAHEHPLQIVHRDVKPSNILFDKQGRAYLGDFGLAQVVDGSDLTKLGGGSWRGTEKYAAPEQVAGKGYLTPSADIYALGAVLFEAVTGQPYKRQPRDTRASSLRANVPATLDRALATALAERPEDRFQSAQEFAQALTERPSAQPATVPAPTAEGPRPPVVSKGLITLAMLLALLLVVGIWLMTRPKPSPPEEPTPATPGASPTTASTVSPAPIPVTPTATLPPILPVLVGTPVPSPGEVISVTNASRVVQLARWGQGVANWVVYAPDGRTMAIASSLGVYLYDVQTRAPVRFIETEYPVNGLTFSPDGSEIATWSASVTDVGRWRISDGSLIQQITRLSGSSQFVYASDGSLVQLVQTGDNRLSIQNLGTGKELWPLSHYTGAFAASPDGQVIATTGCYDFIRQVDCEKLIAIWRSTSGQSIDSIPALDVAIVGLRFAPDRRFLAVWLNDGTIRIWSLLDKVWLSNRFTGVSGVMNLTFSPNDSLVAFGTTAGGVYLWRVQDGKVLLATSAGRPVNTVTFSPDGTQLAAATRDAIKVWDVKALTPGLLEGFAAPSPPYAISSAGDIIVTALTNTISIRNLSNGATVRTLSGHQGTVTTLAFAPDGKSLASGSLDDTVRLWNVASGAASLIMAHLADVQSVVFNPDGKLLGVVTADNTVRLWRVGDGTVADVFTNGGDRISALGFANGGERVALGSCADHETSNDLSSRCRRGRLWLATLSVPGRQAETVDLGDPAHAGYVDILALAPVGEHLATASRAEGDVKLWQIGAKVSFLAQMPVTSTQALAFSPDGQLLATGSSGRAIQVWQLSDRKLLITLAGHTDAVTHISFTADGRQIISSSADGTIRLWGIPPFEPVAIKPTATATATPVISTTPVIK